MDAREKILDEHKIFNGTVADVFVTSEPNKDGEHLYYVKDFDLEYNDGPSRWKNKVTYYAYDSNGNPVATSLVKTSYHRKAVIEYETNKEYRNKGNMTILTKEIIKDVYENEILNGLRIDKNSPLSNIELIELQIDPRNIPSKRIAEKLGFDEFGYLRKDDYFEQKENIEKSTTKKAMK